MLRHHDVIFIGRPEANSALAAWADKIGLEYTGAVFQIDGAAHASEREALLLAAKNPLDAAHMVLVVAGNDALRTVKAFRAQASAPYAIFEDGGPAAPGDGTQSPVRFFRRAGDLFGRLPFPLVGECSQMPTMVNSTVTFPLLCS